MVKRNQATPKFNINDALFEQSPVATFVMATDGRIVRANRAFARLLGYPPDELPGRTLPELTHPDERAACAARLQLLWGGTSSAVTFTQRVLHHSGSQPHCSVTAQMLCDAEGKAQQIACTVHQHTRRSDTELQLELALAAGQIGVWEWDLANASIIRSPEANRMLGLDTFSGRLDDFLKTVHPLDADKAQRNITQAIADHSDFCNVFRIYRPDGTMRWMEDRGRAEYDSAGVACRVLGVVRDITERKEIEQALAKTTLSLRDSEHNLQAVFGNVSSMIGYWDSRLRNRFANRAYLDWFGVDPATLPGKHLREVIGEDLFRLNLPYIEGALRGEQQEFERAIPSPNGGPLRHALARYIPELSNGKVVGFFVEVSDVTSIKDSEHALERAQEVGRLGSYVLDLSTGRWRSSTMLDRLFGLTPAQEHAIEEWIDLLHPDDRQIALANVEQAAAGIAPFDTQYRIVRRNDGELRWMHGLGQIERDASGMALRMVGTVQDITQRKAAQIETQLLLNENTRLVRELISVQERERATLARELHDELSQHLTAIRAFAGAIRLSGQHDLDRVQAAAQSIEDSARDIYQVSHRLMEGLHPSILDNAGIVDALGSLLNDWGSKHPDIEWRASLASDVQCDGLHTRVAVYRLVQECLSNVALHAKARRLRIVLANFEDQSGTMLRLVIRDDGLGLDHTATHSGFGLLGMRERVLSLGGSFRIASWPNGGTRILAVLPAD